MPHSTPPANLCGLEQHLSSCSRATGWTATGLSWPGLQAPDAGWVSVCSLGVLSFLNQQLLGPQFSSMHIFWDSGYADMFFSQQLTRAQEGLPRDTQEHPCLCCDVSLIKASLTVRPKVKGWVVTAHMRWWQGYG